MEEMSCYTVLFEQIRNMIPNQVNRTLFKFQNESSTFPESQNHRIETYSVCKVEEHVYDLKS